MILTFTDFGFAGPYLGQLEMVFSRLAPNVPVIHLLADAPAFRPREDAYLLAALAHDAPAGTVFLAVVDPGVGGEREPVIVRAGDYWYVGPDNGLMEVVAARANGARWWRIAWRPERLSASFHGRDLFAPTAARLAMGMDAEAAGGEALERQAPAVAPELAEIIYIDHFGNAATGLTGASAPAEATLDVRGRAIRPAATFSAADSGAPFWYVNSNGLVEVAANRASAAEVLGLAVGDAVAWRRDD